MLGGRKSLKASSLTQMLRTVKGYRNVLCCSWKFGTPGPKHIESKAAENTWE